MHDKSNELNAWDRDHFFHPSTHMGSHARGETPTRVIASGEGVYITDLNGRKRRSLCRR
jgi:L-2,4-diaminobutyrate transaminase